MTLQSLRADASALPLADGSIHCCVTSPPYFGLRDYGLPQTAWDAIDYAPMPGMASVHVLAMRSCLGLEPTPEAYVGHMVAVFREVRRVLRDDGTLWLNLGDSYAGQGAKTTGRNDTERDTPGGRGGSFSGGPRRRVGGVPGGGGQQGGARDRDGLGAVDGLKPKDLVGIPWRVAFALQADGWYLRSDIVWHKPNPMPESVRDRPTKAHEYVFMLAKSERYYYDADAIAEPAAHAGRVVKATDAATAKNGQKGDFGATSLGFTKHDTLVSDTRNARSVWTIATKPYAGAHFAVMPEALAERCLLAGCLEGGVVLDPFGGSGTVGRVAVANRRRAVLCDLNPAYLALQSERSTNVQIGLAGV